MVDCMLTVTQQVDLMHNKFWVASPHLNLLLCFCSIYQYLSHLAGITVKLASDIIKMILEFANTYKHQQTDVDNNFNHIFAPSVRMADKVGATVMMPHIAKTATP